MFYSDACLKYVDEVHVCPHCNTRLSCCHTPPFHVGDGLGWGTDVLFICLNDQCPLYANSWKQFEEMYGHAASCRYVLVPGEPKGSAMMVGGQDAFKGCVIDPEAFKASNKRYQEEKEAVAQLATCVAEHNLKPVLHLILDEQAKIEHRKQAAECLEALNDVACIDPIRNHSFKNTEMEQTVNLILRQILQKNFLRECPHCMELVKTQAKVCKHCNREL
ncbi:MAG: zinc ribbon domain-containing protein [Thermodesulfobacteriota bacterium]